MATVTNPSLGEATVPRLHGAGTPQRGVPTSAFLYLVVFASALAVDLIPIFGPPVWTVMVLLLIKFNLNPSVKGIVTAVVGLLVIGAFLFIDWRVLLEKRKLKFNFKIWK